MASQITHVPYAKKVLEKFLTDREVDERSFFVGTLFPDIRYLGVIEREKTHIVDPTVENLKKLSNSFELGKYTHSLIDYEREKTLERLGMYKEIEPTKLSVYAMKFIEDEFTYPLISDWNKYIKFLNGVTDKEKELVGEESARTWHELLQDFFRQPPNTESMIHLAKSLRGFTDELLEGILNEEIKIKKNAAAMKIIGQTYQGLFG